jgi:hypothetical protein
MGRKLAAIHELGRRLAGMSPRQVADEYFGGVIRTADLNESHVPRLDALPFVGETSARFIIRNMGGELIKDDRWINVILAYLGCTEDDLAHAGRKLGWKIGRVDLVLWHYCRQEIRSTKNLAAHFRSRKLGPAA